jgi:S-DNA-T family DNA segregation ATPase FtsK/SpoIIIE
MLWARFRWAWLARNSGLGYVDRYHRRRLRPRMPFTTAVHVKDVPRHLLRYPRARFRADAYGWTAHVRTIPKVGRAELAKAAPWLADAWRCHRVAVTQSDPGRVQVRAMRRDPLAEPYPLALAPPAPFALEPLAPRPWSWYLGRDEHGEHRSVPLAHLPAFTCAGMPGFGKTVAMTSFLCQFAPSPLVALAGLLDGKDGGDYAAWEDRAELACGDIVADAAEVLAEIHAELRRRLATVVAELGVRNAWAVGPSAEWPLKITVVDEHHTFLDLDRWKGDRKAEEQVRTCRRLTGDLVRKGRSVMMLTGLLSQHMTTDSLPSGIRDAAPLSLCFATRTTDKSVAALGPEIRDYPDLDPVTLQDDAYRGVLVAALRTGMAPYVRIRVPEIPEPYAIERAAATAVVAPHRRHELPPEQAAALEAARP